ncbi:MAG: hypothetical protein P4N60_08660 [Verrucomicrobiae bacterium]|nr:hypothetical protein [Verrucomicrobiae bacterium]
MLASIYRPFPTTTFVLFYLFTCLGALLIDELMRRRSVVLSSILGFVCGVGLFMFSQYYDRAWWLFSHPGILAAYRYGEDWFDYVLAVPDVIRWYLLPAYVASLVVRLNRKLRRDHVAT